MTKITPEFLKNWKFRKTSIDETTKVIYSRKFYGHFLNFEMWVDLEDNTIFLFLDKVRGMHLEGKTGGDVYTCKLSMKSFRTLIARIMK